jgi:hypothetical protein
MPARTRFGLLLALIAPLSACEASPRAEAAVAPPSASAAPAAPSAPALVGRSAGGTKAAATSKEKLPPADCDPAAEAPGRSGSTSTDPMARLRDVMAGRKHGAAARTGPIRCDPSEKKPPAEHAAGT